MESGMSDIESRLTNLESELKSGTSTLESEMESGMSDVKSQISKLESLITKFVANGGNGSQLLGGNNETSEKVDNAVVYTKHFFVIKEEKSWKEARRSCQASGGDLVKVNSNAEEQRLVEFLKKTMPEREDFWIYSKKGFNRKNYRKNSCFVILPFRDPVLVATQTCSNTNSAVCEKFVENGGNGSQQLGGNNETSNNDDDNDDDDDNDNVDDKEKSTDAVDRFFVIKEKKSWKEARRSCQALGGDLVTLASREDQQNLMEYLKKTMPKERTFWIGSKKGKTSGEGPGNWKWINGDRTTNPDDESFAWGHTLSSQAAKKYQADAGCLTIHPKDKRFGFCASSCSTSLPAACEKKN